MNWTIYKCHDCSALFERLMRSISETDCRMLRKCVQTMRADSSLKDLFTCIIDHYEKTQSKKAKLALLEMTAGLEYVSKNMLAGRLQKLKEICRDNRSARPALAFLDAWCDHALDLELWRRSDLWFDLRVKCMDAYTLAHIFSCPRGAMCIFYGGEAHAATLNKVVRKYKGVEVVPSSVFQDLVKGQRLLSLTSYDLKDRHITIIGENHSSTRTEFGVELIRLLQSWCNAGGPIVCLVEKHISNENDALQTELMCNMPEMALHRFRCDAFTESNECRNLEIIPVDNRHYDLGFIRMEIFEPWGESEQFRTCAMAFQKKAVLSLKRMLRSF